MDLEITFEKQNSCNMAQDMCQINYFILKGFLLDFG